MRKYWFILFKQVCVVWNIKDSNFQTGLRETDRDSYGIKGNSFANSEGILIFESRIGFPKKLVTC